MSLTIALVGNPNCGKTTTFNTLTGSNQYVGNWPGVTVEKKEGRLKGHKDIKIVDLPGIYSLSPYTPEEVITRNFLLQQKPNVILNIVDASNIERNLYLTTQLIECGIPVVIALNMMDIVEKHGTKINIKKLSNQLNCPIIEISALKNKGLTELIQAVISTKDLNVTLNAIFNDKVEEVIEDISALISSHVDSIQTRWHAIKLFERDQKVLDTLNLNLSLKLKIEELIINCEDSLDDDSENG